MEAAWRGFIDTCRSATLATVDPDGQPRLVPICFAVTGPETDGSVLVWSPLDAKPKRDADPRRLARVRDILARPGVSLLFERWSEEWSRLAWIRLRGLATLMEPGDDVEAHTRVVWLLRERYPPYRAQPIDRSPLVRVVVTGVTSWSAAGGAPQGRT
jgi:PPOX class probable F420-dependent enzyme